jgi:hypothetical protein
MQSINEQMNWVDNSQKMANKYMKKMVNIFSYQGNANQIYIESVWWYMPVIAVLGRWR